MNREIFEQYVSNLWLFICICLSEIIIIIWTWFFKNSQLVKDITNNPKLNTISRAFEIIQLDDYYPHLIVGIIWIFILLGLVLYSFKERKYGGTLIYILFIIVFWLIFWDPILTSFLIIGSLGTAAMYSFNN
ncbi:hypothetical protein [uncultured Streptococcus sp.]|uniref:hypothetical protein n=1 Tax=uncultured Streptococcus sp. TaxID=83427 RepID=UPI00261A7B3B|nr:hypothetical protein [uncultured Streptococcus sp.]